MAAIDDVQQQFINPQDPVTLYDGATNPPFSWANNLVNGIKNGLKVWDIRGFTKTLAYDLLRFQKPSEKNINLDTFDPTIAWGMRDQVTHLQMMTVQNNWMLRKLCAERGIDVTKSPFGITVLL